MQPTEQRKRPWRIEYRGPLWFPWARVRIGYVSERSALAGVERLAGKRQYAGYEFRVINVNQETSHAD